MEMIQMETLLIIHVALTKVKSLVVQELFIFYSVYISLWPMICGLLPLSGQVEGSAHASQISGQISSSLNIYLY